MNIIKKFKSYIKTLRHENSIISEYETKDMKFIWGILAYDDFSTDHANLFSMNDFEVDYLKKDNKYIMSVETIYGFGNNHAKYEYMRDILNKFTNYMIINDRIIEKEPSLYDVFTDSIGIDSKFDSIEDCYFAFKILVNGFCSFEKEEQNETNKINNIKNDEYNEEENEC